jgi:hypothetical protein
MSYPTIKDYYDEYGQGTIDDIKNFADKIKNAYENKVKKMTREELEGIVCWSYIELDQNRDDCFYGHYAIKNWSKDERR